LLLVFWHFAPGSMTFGGRFGPGFGFGCLSTNSLCALLATFVQHETGSRTYVLRHLCSVGATCSVAGRVSSHRLLSPFRNPGSILLISGLSSQHVLCLVSISFSFSHLQAILSITTDCKWFLRYSKMSMLLPVMVWISCQRVVHALSKVSTSCIYFSFF
jgi:hypothetical protein